MLFSTIFTYLLVTVIALILIALEIPIEDFETFYYSFSTVAAVAIGFYTGTTAKRVDVKDGKVES